MGPGGFPDTTSIMSYLGLNLSERTVRKGSQESKHHLIERFKRGQEVEIIISPYGDHRLAGFYSLYVLDLCILAVGFVLYSSRCHMECSHPIVENAAGMRMESS